MYEVGIGETNMDVPRLRETVSRCAGFLCQLMSYLTSPFFRWFMSTWMPSTKGELYPGVWQLVTYLLQAYPWPLWLCEKAR